MPLSLERFFRKSAPPGRYGPKEARPHKGARRGKVLIDADEDRYLILTPRERNEFQRYIYW